MKHLTRKLHQKTKLVFCFELSRILHLFVRVCVASTEIADMLKAKYFSSTIVSYYYMKSYFIMTSVRLLMSGRIEKESLQIKGCSLLNMLKITNMKTCELV